MSEVLITTATTPAPTINQPETGPNTPAARRAAERAYLRQRRQGHATAGASAQYYAVPVGREALPLAPAPEREKICSFIPLTATQISRMRRYVRMVEPQEIVLEDGTVINLKYKPSTQEDVLALAVSTELLKSSLRVPYGEQLFKYIIAPTGLKPETHQFTRQLLTNLGPTNIMAWAKEHELPVYQALAHAAEDAWLDPKDLHLTCCEEAVPDKPNATQVKGYTQALGERAALWPEALRPLLGDLVKPLQYCQPSKLHEYLVYLQPLLQLSSRDLYAALLTAGQNLPPFLSFVALIEPQTWAQNGSDAHKFLQSTRIQPKKARKQRRTKRVSAQAALALPKAASTPVIAPMSSTNGASTAPESNNALPSAVPTPEVASTAACVTVPSTETEVSAAAQAVEGNATTSVDPAAANSTTPTLAEEPNAELSTDAHTAETSAAPELTEAQNAAPATDSSADPTLAEASNIEVNDEAPSTGAKASVAADADLSTQGGDAEAPDERISPEKLAELRESALASLYDAFTATAEQKRIAKEQQQKHLKREQRKLERKQRKLARRHRK